MAMLGSDAPKKIEVFCEAEWPGSPADHNGIQRNNYLQSPSAPKNRRITSVAQNIGLQIRLVPLCRLDSGSEKLSLGDQTWRLRLHQWNSAVGNESQTRPDCRDGQRAEPISPPSAAHEECPSSSQDYKDRLFGLQIRTHSTHHINSVSETSLALTSNDVDKDVSLHACCLYYHSYVHTCCRQPPPQKNRYPHTASAKSITVLRSVDWTGKDYTYFIHEKSVTGTDCRFVREARCVERQRSGRTPLAVYYDAHLALTYSQRGILGKSVVIHDPTGAAVLVLGRSSSPPVADRGSTRDALSRVLRQPDCLPKPDPDPSRPEQVLGLLRLTQPIYILTLERAKGPF
ncbi:hypothetical protein PGT21_035452 [Puccinia graminis f. sp. tritici]|uniref:Uncharacterized protein n=1 Tax=Puccinia graminis f. sp. tritici TaxID=56615 RepID=A0A5B0MNE6_PUCGR|nr:hypothetical protein PGT21_035452 [Puccinia graminis f. sp. tritici]